MHNAFRSRRLQAWMMLFVLWTTKKCSWVEVIYLKVIKFDKAIAKKHMLRIQFRMKLLAYCVSIGKCFYCAKLIKCNGLHGPCLPSRFCFSFDTFIKHDVNTTLSWQIAIFHTYNKTFIHNKHLDIY